MRLCRINGTGRAALRPVAPISRSHLIVPSFPISPRSSSLLLPFNRPTRKLSAAPQTAQSIGISAFSTLALDSPVQGAEEMAGSRRMKQAETAARPAAAVKGIKADPEAAALNGVPAENGASVETQGVATAVASTKPKSRQSRAKASKPAAAHSAVQIKPDPDAVVLNGSHAGNGTPNEPQALPVAANGVKQARARKSRTKASMAAVEAAVESATAVKAEPAEDLSADLAASIQVAKEGALLVSEKTVKKGRGRKKMQQSAEAMPDIPAAEEAQPKAKGRRAAAVRSAPVLQGGAITEAAPVMPAVAAPKKRGARKTKSAKASIGEAAEAAVAGAAVKLELSDIKEEPAQQKRAPRRKTAAAAAGALAVGQGDAEDEEKPKPKRQRRAKSAPSELPAVEEADGPKAEGEEAPKKKRRAKGPDPDAFVLPAREVLEIAQASSPPPRPVPNLGYACLNMALREQRPPIFTNRGCIQKTYLEKGLEYISELALENCRALAGIIQWNHEQGIRLFRLSSDIFPWCTEYQLKELKDFEAISDELAFAGKLARAYDQRLTFHPSHFVKLAAETDELLNKSIKELEVHSLCFDLMGFPPCHQNKINIHIGGIYEDKEHTIRRFAENFNTRLSPNLQSRLTVENDDRPNSYSMTDLLLLHNLTGIPLVFDFHHQKFCPGSFNEKEALYAAMATWPKGVRPVVHWSESQEGRIPHAHSDYISGPMLLHGMEDQIDVMIEAKCKERALLRFRELMKQPPTEDAVMATKFV